MLKLLDAALSNPSLLYIDAKSGKQYTLLELITGQLIDNDSTFLCFLYCDNSIASIASFWSFYAKNCVIVLLSKQLNEELKNTLESIYEPKVIIDGSREKIEDFIVKTHPHFTYHVNQENKVALNIDTNIKLLLSTSGTTGSSKFVKLSDKNLHENAQSIIDYLPINDKDVCPLNLAMSYSYGLSVLTTNSIAGGKIVCNLDDILSKSFWVDFEKYAFTSLAGVPYVYEMLNRIGFTHKAYPSLRYLTQAGGKLNSSLLDTLAHYSQEKNVLFYVMYGQTEATARISFLPPDSLLTKKSSIGKPIKNGQLSIDSASGELLYSGPNVFGGYVETLTDLGLFDNPSILKTGDTAYMDEEGFYFITGRLKRMVKILGNRINLDEIERLLSKQFGDNIFACCGLNDSHLLIGFAGSKRNGEEIKGYLKAITNIHPSFVKISYLPEMPLTANGKINYTQIASNYDAS